MMGIRKQLEEFKSLVAKDFASMWWDVDRLENRHRRCETDGDRLAGIEATILQINDRLFELEKIYGLRHIEHQ